MHFFVYLFLFLYLLQNFYFFFKNLYHFDVLCYNIKGFYYAKQFFIKIQL